MWFREFYLGLSLLIVPAAGENAENAAPLPLLDLDSIASHLRAGDFRLVRTSASDETKERQKLSGGCARLIDSLSVLKSTDAPLYRRGKAAEVAVLCTTDNPENREFIGRTEGVHAATVELLNKVVSNENEEQGGEGTINGNESKDIAQAAAKAAELTWILSFNSTTHREGFLSSGAVETLGRIIVSCKEFGARCSPHVQMWAAAAIQNLAASYCATETGHCWWELSEKSNKLYLGEESPLTSDGAPARERILAIDGLLEELRRLACQGPVRDRNLPWPGENAEIGKDEMSPSIVPWAAAGALKNLALSPAGRVEVDRAALCLCGLMSSPDWLEAVKGDDALWNLGRLADCHLWEEDVDYDDDFEMPFVLGYCLDHPWVHEGGDTCDEFQDDETCDKNGDRVDVNDGVTKATDACCSCGGGEEVVFNEEPIIDEL